MAGAAAEVAVLTRMAVQRHRRECLMAVVGSWRACTPLLRADSDTERRMRAAAAALFARLNGAGALAACDNDVERAVASCVR